MLVIEVPLYLVWLVRVGYLTGTGWATETSAGGCHLVAVYSGNELPFEVKKLISSP
ncbi:hypothetical protein AB0H94_34795 [Streptomyces purpurascens]|uniref:hypothetical protein n=1 Tax=Streptomyces purpurascens TaxID=1924 RepID=UPI0033E79122